MNPSLIQGREKKKDEKFHLILRWTFKLQIRSHRRTNGQPGISPQSLHYFTVVKPRNQKFGFDWALYFGDLIRDIDSLILILGLSRHKHQGTSYIALQYMELSAMDLVLVYQIHLN